MPFDRVFEECAANYNISKATAGHFWLHFEKYRELPDETMFQCWFKNEVRFTTIAAADINRFIDVACYTWERDEFSEAGTVGTITREIFEGWVENKLCPKDRSICKLQKRKIRKKKKGRIFLL